MSLTNLQHEENTVCTYFRFLISGADVQFGGSQGYVAQAAAAAVAAAHASQHSAHSAHGQPPPSHGQGSVSGAPGGNMRGAMHHPGASPQSGPQQQQQQAPAPTSTPPGAPPQQHGDMGKQAPPSHMQGQQSQIPGKETCHSVIHERCQYMMMMMKHGKIMT